MNVWKYQSNTSLTLQLSRHPVTQLLLLSIMGNHTFTQINALKLLTGFIHVNFDRISRWKLCSKFSLFNNCTLLYRVYFDITFIILSVFARISSDRRPDLRQIQTQAVPLPLGSQWRQGLRAHSRREMLPSRGMNLWAYWHNEDRDAFFHNEVLMFPIISSLAPSGPLEHSISQLWRSSQ